MEKEKKKEKEKAKEEMGNSRRQLKAMLRKNWLLKIRHPFFTCAEILLPSLVMLLLIAVRSKSDIRIHPAQPYFRKEMGMFVEVGKGDSSPPFNQVLELLLAKEEYLAFAPNTAETRMMISILSLKFPVLRVMEEFHSPPPQLPTDRLPLDEPPSLLPRHDSLRHQTLVVPMP